jgi:two-component system sensor histidine kinase QseC
MLHISSIKRFLLIAIFSVITTAWLISSMFNYHSSQEEVEELFDAELAQMSRILQSMMITHIRSNSLGYSPNLDYLDKSALNESFGHQEFNEVGHKYEKKLAFQVWDSTGKLFFENHSELPDDFAKLELGFSDISTHIVDWRTFTLKDNDYGFWVKVAQRYDIRTELTRKIALNAILPNLVVIPILFLMIAWIIKKGLLALNQISLALKGRSYQNLEEINASDYPIELKYLVGELNDLFNRVIEASDRERRFTADAAHELRTPLSISKVHLQNILQVSKSEQVKEFVAKSLVGINRLIHMVQQLLILSRLDADQEQEALRMLDLGLMLDEISNELKNQDFMKHKNIVISNRQNVQWSSRETQMRILLRNLLDNACRYAEDNTQISIVITDKDLIIRNVCAFMSEALLQQSLERFKRGSSSQQGSGLGLSICQQICAQNNYALSMFNRKDGEQGIETIISIL